MTHTPGPWRVVPKYGSLPETSAWLVGKSREEGREEVLICEMPFNATRGELAAQYKANAALIAAAPDLLDALMAVRKIIGQSNATMREQTAVLRTMRLAIAKAEGRHDE